MLQKKILTLALGLALAASSAVGYADTGAVPKAATKTGDIVVTATKTAHTLQDVPVETVLITREDIERSNADNISALLNYIPGFNFSQQSDLAGAMGYKNTVRGLNVESHYLLILVDGQRVFGGYHSGGMASAGFSHNVNVVPISMVERIEVVKGPGSALYGSDAVVGVLNIITRKATDEFKVSAGGSYGSYEVKGMDYTGVKPQETNRIRYEANALMSGPIVGKLKGVLALSHQVNEGIQPTIYDVLRNYIHGRLDLAATDKLNLAFGGDLTAWEQKKDELGDKKTEDAPRVWLTADYEISPLHNLALNGYYHKLDADFKDPWYGKQSADVSYQDVELKYTGLYFSQHRITLGFNYLNESLDTDVVVDKETATTSAYLQDEWSLLQGDLVLVPGVRFDHNDEYGDETNPKFSAMYKFTPDTILRASVGWSFKAPSGMETASQPMNHYVNWVFPNPDLKPEKAVTYQVGLEQGFFDRRLLVSATYYHSDLKDMIARCATGKTYLGLPVATFMNLDEARIQGVEATASYSVIKGLDLNLSYAYTDAINKKTDQRLTDTPEHSVNAWIDYNNSTYFWGGSFSMNYTGDQKNMMFTPAASPETEEFTTFGLKLWKDFQNVGRLSFEVDNLFDEDLKGSDTIYVGQMFMLNFRFGF
ncbi:TonB-dependent receptor plug domain-containing protein [Dethiosulfatarculus sandiegensis]|uniref:TonB-dependent receptor plug domain-containing protein n=1 Tax=Dethiosulfatarculus sandiegensis TaxID=1429043 RepID=UPI0012E0C7FA|nr:TonB-dependent receptor [Dethiosulfatarculus sandiegensis]